MLLGNLISGRLSRDSACSWLPPLQAAVDTVYDSLKTDAWDGTYPSPKHFVTGVVNVRRSQWALCRRHVHGNVQEPHGEIWAAARTNSACLYQSWTVLMSSVAVTAPAIAIMSAVSNSPTHSTDCTGVQQRRRWDLLPDLQRHLDNRAQLCPRSEMAPGCNYSCCISLPRTSYHSGIVRSWFVQDGNIPYQHFNILVFNHGTVNHCQSDGGEAKSNMRPGQTPL